MAARRVGLVVLLLIVASPAVAQDAPSRGWVDVNFVSLWPRQDARTSVFQEAQFDETATWMAGYPALPNARGGEIGAGLRVGPAGVVGIGVHLNRVSYRFPADLAVTLPHPAFFDTFGTGTAIANGLERSERSIDIQAAVLVPTPDVWSLRLFGGPTHFSVRQEMIRDIIVDQFSDLQGLNLVGVVDYDLEEVEEGAWGFNVGADVALFFTPHIGVGGVIRFNRVTMTIEDPLSGEAAELEAGATSLGAGLRLRF